MNTEQEIRQGDCIDEMQEFPENHFHAVVTDPPYNFEGGFMGEEWDDVGSPKEYQEWCESWASEVLRVLKPGGHLIAFGGTKTEHRIKSGVEDAGFEIRDTITWHYSNGMLKGGDIGEHIDQYGGETAHIPGLPQIIQDNREQKELSRQELAGFFADEGQDPTGCVWNWEKGITSPTVENLNKLVDLLDLPIGKISPADREKIGEYEKSESYQYEGNNVYVTDGDKKNVTIDITAPATPEAEKWDGWRPSLKPATEFAVLARKPLSENAIYKNVLEHGTGALNISSATVDCEGQDRYPSNVALAEGTTELPERYFYTSKASKRERTVDGQIENDHTTVKPLDLMEWIVTLVTAPGQRVLDPFAGSGTTIMACKRLDRGGIGVEKDEDHVGLARKRVELAHELETGFGGHSVPINGQADLQAFADGGQQ